MEDNPLFWAGFFVLITVLLCLDLFVFNRGAHKVSTKKALKLTAFWISVAMVFCVFVYITMGSIRATEFLAGYILEETMSLDNVFVFIIVFSSFAVPEEYQHKALFYGVIGAIAMRTIFIFAGTALLHEFEWIMYIFGALLIYAAIKTMFQKEGAKDPSNNLLVRAAKRVMRVSDEYDGDKLFTVKNGVRMATPLFIAIIALESTDLIFAIDSIPAVLAITDNFFIVLTSNIFAILGLRSLYFALNGSVHNFPYLKYGIGIILLFVGIKMLLHTQLSEWFQWWDDLSLTISLVVIAACIISSILISVILNKRQGNADSGTA